MTNLQIKKFGVLGCSVEVSTAYMHNIQCTMSSKMLLGEVCKMTWSLSKWRIVWPLQTLHFHYYRKVFVKQKIRLFAPEIFES